MLKGESMHLKRKTRGGDPVPLLWRAERWRMKKPLVSVLLPQWPFMRGIRHARSWRGIHWCPATIWKKDDKNQFVLRLNCQRLPRLAFQIVSLRKEDEKRKKYGWKAVFFFSFPFLPPSVQDVAFRKHVERAEALKRSVFGWWMKGCCACDSHTKWKPAFKAYFTA